MPARRGRERAATEADLVRDLVPVEVHERGHDEAGEDDALEGDERGVPQALAHDPEEEAAGEQPTSG